MTIARTKAMPLFKAPSETEVAIASGSRSDPRGTKKNQRAKKKEHQNDFIKGRRPLPPRNESSLTSNEINPIADFRPIESQFAFRSTLDRFRNRFIFIFFNKSMGNVASLWNNAVPDFTLTSF